MVTFHASRIKLPAHAADADPLRETSWTRFDTGCKLQLHSWILSKPALRTTLLGDWKPFEPLVSALDGSTGWKVAENTPPEAGSLTPSLTALAAVQKESISKPSDEKLSFSGGDAVPTIFCGSVCTPSSPARKNEADSRLVLRMAMTGETLADLSYNLRKTYGPSMDLNILMKLMTAEQIDGKTLFYVNEDTLTTSRAVRPTNCGPSTGGQASGRNSGDVSPKNPKQNGFSWPNIWKQLVVQCSDSLPPAFPQTQVRAAKALGCLKAKCKGICQRLAKNGAQQSTLVPKLNELGYSGVACLSARQKEGFAHQGLVMRSWTRGISFTEYWEAVCRIANHANQIWQNQRSKSDTHPSKDGRPILSADKKFGRESGDPWSIEKIPLEAAFQLLMRSADKYRLVIDDDDVQAVHNSTSSSEPRICEDMKKQKGTPMFAIRGLEISLGTSKGPVNFVPLFFSKGELQKFYKTCRKIFKILWLVRRSESREERRVMIEKKAATLGGVSQSLDPTIPTSSPVEDTEEEDGFGDGDPSEVREFMEELGAPGDSRVTGTTSATSLPSIPTMIALGVVSFSAGAWKLIGDLSDILLMSSPFEPYFLGLPLDVPHKPLFLESCLQRFSILNKETSMKNSSSSHNTALDKAGNTDDEDILDVLTNPQSPTPTPQDGLKLESLAGLQVMMKGAWHLVQVLQQAPASLMYVGGRIATQDGSLLPDIHSLRRSNSNVSVSTIIHIDEDAIMPADGKTRQPKNDSQAKAITTCNMGLVLNLAQAFGSPDDADICPLTNDPVAMGIWMVGNLGMSQGGSSEGPPTLGFGNTVCLKDGVPVWTAEDISRGDN